MLDEQDKETSRQGKAVAEPVDETLSIVRQMMVESGPAAPPRQARAREMVVAKQDAGTATPRRREKPIRGRAALPELEAPVGGTRRIERKIQPEIQSESQPDIQPEVSRRTPVFGRLLTLLPRRRAPAEGEAEVEFNAIEATAVEATETEAEMVEDQTHEESRFEAVEPVYAEPQEMPVAKEGGRTLLQAIKEFRPTRKQIAFVVLAGIVVWRPWLIPGLLFVLFWVGLIAYLTMGPDRVSEVAQGRWEWFRARFPERAERVMGWMQRSADRMDGWLARLPERWTDGVYLPDLGRSQADAEPADAQPDPFDRLAAERQVIMGEPHRV